MFKKPALVLLLMTFSVLAFSQRPSPATIRKVQKKLDVDMDHILKVDKDSFPGLVHFLAANNSVFLVNGSYQRIKFRTTFECIGKQTQELDQRIDFNESSGETDSLSKLSFLGVETIDKLKSLPAYAIIFYSTTLNGQLKNFSREISKKCRKKGIPLTVILTDY